MFCPGKFGVRLAICCLVVSASAQVQTAFQPASGVTTQDRFHAGGWWPTRGDQARKEFVGTAKCAECHGDIAALQTHTSMAKASIPGASVEKVLPEVTLTAHQGPYQYKVFNSGSIAQYNVTKGGEEASGPLDWILGAGDIGQTYVLERDGKYLESHVTYYPSLHALDITPGQMAALPRDLKQALGRRMEAPETQQCFACHTTASMTKDCFDPSQSLPGVSCEACHGPGARHVAAIHAEQLDRGAKAILNPVHLKPADQVDFCGACHRSSADVANFPPGTLGVLGVRFQPYRLQKSSCWRKSSAITCLSCHDPHQQIVRESVSYDKHCLACHLAAKAEPKAHDAKAPACPVSTNNCVSCHMKKYEIWAAHATFTDHYIRVVRANEKFPE
jgi:hypothetical protein